MSKTELLVQLRERLRLVERRMGERQREQMSDNEFTAVRGSGAYTELGSERGFLVDLIGQLEGEGLA